MQKRLPFFILLVLPKVKLLLKRRVHKILLLLGSCQHELSHPFNSLSRGRDRKVMRLPGGGVHHAFLVRCWRELECIR